MTSFSTPTWDLSDLFSGFDDPELNNILVSVKDESLEFARKYRGKISESDASTLADALAAYESISRKAAKPATYASLEFAAQSTPEYGAFYQQIQERTTDATMPLIFFDIELTCLGTEKLISLSKDQALSSFRHYLLTIASHAAHLLSESEEKILEEKANTGKRAFVRLYEEITSNLRFRMPNTEAVLTLPEILNLQLSPDRTTRRESAEALSQGLQPHAQTLAFIFNTLLQDKATEDRLRSFEYPEASRHLSNELDPTTVETVVQAAVDGFPLVARFFDIKRRLLNLPELTHYDRYAPLNLPIEEPEISFEEAKEVVLGSFAKFDETLYAPAAEKFFTEGWIDATPRAGKRGGAFCSYVTPDLHPYIFLNYLGKPNDVKTLAHELGHGIHSYLSREQNYLNYHGTLPMAEVASTFAEMLVFEDRTRTGNDLTKLAAYSRQIEQGIATIFRQAAMYRFEQAIHRERRTKGELSLERFGELWQENVGAMFQGAVTLEPGHAIWWTYVRHFVATPFYVYAYSFGEMLALALFRLYQTNSLDFTSNYLSLLRAGGSLSPAELTAPLGISLDDPAFWRGAIEVFAHEVDVFEELANTVLSD